MKVTASWILGHFPFLAGLLNSGELSGRKRIRLKIKFEPVVIRPPSHDAAVRYTSVGKLYGASFTHYAGCSESAINTPYELIPAACPFNGKPVNKGCFYAQLDLLEYYGMREIILYLNSADELTSATPELHNNLKQLLLTQ